MMSAPIICLIVAASRVDFGNNVEIWTRSIVPNCQKPRIGAPRIPEIFLTFLFVFQKYLQFQANFFS